MADFTYSIARILKADGDKTAGTGFLVSSEEGFILTCTHVICETELTKTPDTVQLTFLRDKQKKILTARVLFYKRENEGDFAVLKVNEIPEGIFPLQLTGFTGDSEAHFTTYGFPNSSTINGFAGYGTIKPVRILHDCGFDIIQLSSNDITRGFSGGPAIEDYSGNVVGVISLITSQDKYGRQAEIAFAIPSEMIVKLFSEIKLVKSTFLKNPKDVQFKLEENIVKQIGSLSEQLKIRILIVTSIPSGIFNVNNDKAIIQDYVNKVFVQTIFRKKFNVELYELIDFKQAKVLLSSDESRTGKVEPCIDLKDMDLIIAIIWHNLGYEENNTGNIDFLLNKAKSFESANEFLKAKLLLYNRIDKFSPDLQEPCYEQIKRSYESTIDFFKNINYTDITKYEKGDFESQFELDLRRFLYHLLATHPTNGKQRIIQKNIINPFKGLHQYSGDDAHLFVGRRQQIDDLVYKIQEMNLHGMLMILGASGSGKSSLIRAGLFHRLLRLEAVPGSNKWKIIEISISKIEPEYFSKEILDPVINAAIIDGNGKLKSELRRKLLESKDIGTLASNILGNDAAKGKVILFIDQFEEMFTLVKEENDRAAFMAVLLKIAQSEQFIILMAMRNDYYHKCSEYSEFQKLLDNNTYTVLPPEDSALRRIISYPVHASGLRFEDENLAATIFNDVNKSAGILPLLSYAMFQLVENKNPQNILTLSAYKQLGGIEGIIQKQAATAIKPYKSGVNFQNNFSFLFRKLITISENDEPTKKIAEYEEDKWDSGVREILDALIEQRLLFTDKTPTGKTVIQITHEALLSNWSTLRDWISIAKSDLLILKRVEILACDWMKSRDAASAVLEKLKIDRMHLWPEERLRVVAEAINRLGYDINSDVAAENREAFKKFIRPETDRLIEELQVIQLDHQRRAEIGDRFAQLGDKRKGVGVSANNLPGIVWCKVYPGEVNIKMEDKLVNKIINYPFFIAKYPITLLQFNCFTENGNAYYDNSNWEGLDVSAEEKRPYPQTGYLNRPAYFVSWFQAVAFCNWLTHCYHKMKLLSEDDSIRVPTECEWQLAACGGNSNFNYPWGAEWKPDFASNSDGIRQLVAVGLYPCGKSPVGAMDMSGNVYEWCLNEYTDIEATGLCGRKPRTTKGGAYFSFEGTGEAKVALNIYSRLKDNPNGINNVKARIAAAIRPICTNPPKESDIEDLYT